MSMVKIYMSAMRSGIGVDEMWQRYPGKVCSYLGGLNIHHERKCGCVGDAGEKCKDKNI